MAFYNEDLGREAGLFETFGEDHESRFRREHSRRSGKIFRTVRVNIEDQRAAQAYSRYNR